jgi:hypothetical protein
MLAGMNTMFKAQLDDLMKQASSPRTNAEALIDALDGVDLPSKALAAEWGKKL